MLLKHRWVGRVISTSLELLELLLELLELLLEFLEFVLLEYHDYVPHWGWVAPFFGFKILNAKQQTLLFHTRIARALSAHGPWGKLRPLKLSGSCRCVGQLIMGDVSARSLDVFTRHGAVSVSIVCLQFLSILRQKQNADISSHMRRSHSPRIVQEHDASASAL